MESIQMPNRDFVLARAVELRGFGGRRAGEMLFIDSDGKRTGSLFGGVADEIISLESSELISSDSPFKLLSVDIGDLDAVKAGLACGGTADVLIQQSSALPSEFATRITNREPIALATVVEGKYMGLVADLSSEGFRYSEAGTYSDEFVSDLEIRLQRYMSGRKSLVETYELDDNKIVIEVFCPPTSMLIIGTSDLTSALSKQCEFLGWESSIVTSLEQGVPGAQGLGSNDALVVITHDHGLGIPIISALFASNATTYIGALGSRHTQSERSRLLAEEGFSEVDISRIHGPIGLNIGSKTPEETALAICAEVLTHLSGRDATSLRDTSGPING